MRAAARKLRNLLLAAAASRMGLSGNPIDTPPFSDGLEATEAWAGKEDVFIVAEAKWTSQLTSGRQTTSERGAL
jgi:hypothetical protein